MARVVFFDSVHTMLAEAVAERQEELMAQMEEGLEDLLGVVVPARRQSALRAAVPGLPALSATEAKGLGRDAILVVDAAGIAAEPRGWNGLYVALTRCTQELGQLRVRAVALGPVFRIK